VTEHTESIEYLKRELNSLSADINAYNWKIERRLEEYENKIIIFEEDLAGLVENTIPNALQTNKTDNEYECTIKTLLTDDMREQRASIVEEVIKIIKTNKSKQSNTLLYLFVFVNFGITLFLLTRSI
jgi:hypothetical protein